MDHFFVSKKNSETPIFIAFRATTLNRGVRFRALDADFSKLTTSKKTLVPEGSGYFHPKTPIMRKPEKYIDPPPVGHIHATLRDGSSEKAAQEPTHTHTETSSQDMKQKKQHQDRGKTIPRWRQELIRNKPEPNTKNTRQAEETPKKKTRTKKTTNPKNASTRDKLDRKKVVFQTPNTTKTNMKQQRIPYSLKR